MSDTDTAELKSNRLAEALRRFSRNRGAVVGAGIVLVLIFVIVFGQKIAPYDPLEQVGPRLLPPSGEFLLGTDQFGRDVLSRVVFGVRTTILGSIVAVFIAAGIGIPIGLIAGYGGKWPDQIISRIVDIMLAFPGILLALVAVSLLGSGLNNVQIAVGISFIPSFARLVRGSVFSIKENLYVEAARAEGCSGLRIAVRHILPNLVSSVIVLFTMTIGWAIIIATSINFIGLGVQPPTPELGADLGTSRDYLGVAWWTGTFPGLVIVIVVLSVNMMGDGLQAALSHKLASKKLA
jgi:peptide/nickel transport system permease protein